MSKYICLCVLIIAGLCFGQREDSELDTRTSLMLSRSMYTKPLAQENNLTTNELALRSTPDEPSLRYFYDSNSLMQAEGESLQPKTSFWKQSGIYGLEFVSAGAGMGISAFCALYLSLSPADVLADIHPGSSTILYTISNMLFASSFASITGGIFHQQGSWWRSAIGAGLGGLINGITVLYYIKSEPESRPPYIFLIITCTLPPSGSVIGYNMR